MRVNDKDGNVGEVCIIKHEGVLNQRSRGYLVAIGASGLWLTPSQAERFALSILRTARLVKKLRAKR
jgi:hypothetical protein